MLLLLALSGCHRADPDAAAEVSQIIGMPPPVPELRFGPVEVLERDESISIEQLAWTLGGAPGWALVARFPRDAILTVVPSSEVASIDLIHPVPPRSAVVNGGFYDAGPMGLVRHDGATVHELTEKGGSGVVSWGPDLPVSIVHRNTWAPAYGTEALQSVDRIADQGLSLVTPRDDAPQAARSGIAVTPDSVLLVVAASSASAPPEGRTRLLGAGEDLGLPLWAFAELVVHLGATEALNLDGGISTAFRARAGGETWTVDAGNGTINALAVRPR